MENIVSKSKEYLKKIPPGIAIVVAVCSLWFVTSAHLLQLVVHFRVLNYVCLSAHDVVRKYQLWRLLSYAVSHANLVHLLFNMVTLLQLGGLERKLGSATQFLWMTFGVIPVLGGVLYISVIYAGEGLGVLAPWLQHQHVFDSKACVLGLSGVLLGLIVIESKTIVGLDGGSNIDIRNNMSRKVQLWGMSVPSWSVPWILVVLVQVLVPHVSLIGHVSGIAMGYLFVMFHPYLMVPQRVEEMMNQICPCLGADGSSELHVPFFG